MRRLILLTLALLVSTALSASLAACAIPEGGSSSLRVTPSSSPIPTNNPKPIETPTPTASATPTEVPMPLELENLPPGITAVHNEDGSWKIMMGSGDQAETVGTFSPDTGYSIALSDGTSVNISFEEIGSFKTGQDSPFQIYNKTGDKITYAYDAENKVWIDAADVLQPDVSNTENYIHIQTWDDLNILARLQKMVLLPFPADTYSWLSDKTILNYEDYNINRDPAEDYTYWRPLGVLEDLSKSPFKIVSYSLLEKGEERSVDVYIMTVQVFNPDDGSFSIMQYANDWIGSDKFVSHASSISDSTAITQLFSRQPPHMVLLQ